MCRLSTLDTSKRSESSPGARRGVPAEGYRGGHHEQHQRPGRAEPESLSDESGIIVFGGGGGSSSRGCLGGGCLFWIVLSVALTILVNLLLLLFSGGGTGVGV